MRSSRKLEALRALAERPGTEAEGRVARAKLAELEARQPKRDEWGAFRDFLRSKSLDDLADACGTKTCDCGTTYPLFASGCPNSAEHERIAVEIQRRFPRGTRVYYNRWAYSANCPGRVPDTPRRGIGCGSGLTT